MRTWEIDEYSIGSFVMMLFYVREINQLNSRLMNVHVSATNIIRLGDSINPRLPHLATSEMWCSSGGRGLLKKSRLCVTALCTIIMVHKGNQQFLQVGRLYRALILLGLAPCLPSASVSLVFRVLYIFFKKFITLFTLPFCELSLVGLALQCWHCWLGRLTCSRPWKAYSVSSGTINPTIP